MLIISKIAKVDTTNKLTVAFDVSKNKLNYFAEISGKISGRSAREEKAVQDEVPNTTRSLFSTLSALSEYASKQGFSGLHITCEPTGSYSDALMRIAHQKGHTTAYVSGESVCKAKVIENNDTSKSDVKDPRTISMLSHMGKELTFRILPPQYKRLRELNRMFDESDKQSTEARCKIHSLVTRLFFDFPMSKDFMNTNSGHALMRYFGFNPYRISACTYDKFKKTMRENASGIREKTLKALYQNAQYSCLHLIPEEERSALQQRLEYTWEDFTTSEKRQDILRKQIEDVYDQLWESGDMLPQEDGVVFKKFNICRILGETGPIQDFPHWRRLFKYAGVNLRVRESGKYQGQLKFSKKGRSDLRNVMGKMAFRLVRKHEIYGPYYHRKKQLSPKMSGTKLIANVERKILRLFYALSRHRQAFDLQRFGQCESQYRMAA
jgi:transposase